MKKANIFVILHETAFMRKGYFWCDVFFLAFVYCSDWVLKEKMPDLWLSVLAWDSLDASAVRTDPTHFSSLQALPQVLPKDVQKFGPRRD